MCPIIEVCGVVGGISANHILVFDSQESFCRCGARL